MILDGDPTLMLGNLDLMGHDQTGPYWFETLGNSEGTEFGNPVPIERAIKSFLIDGSIAEIEGFDNREMTLRVVVCGEDAYGLAEGEKALVAEVGKRNTLTYAPPNQLTGSGAESIFDVVTSWFDQDYDDQNDLRLERIYVVTIRALPFARSNTLVEFTSDPPPSGGAPTVTLVDNGSSLTNWSAVSSVGGSTLSTTGGVIKVFRGQGVSTATRWLTLTRSSLATSMTGTPFVRIKMTTALKPGGDPTTLVTEVKLNGVVAPEVARDGDYRWFAFPGATLTSIDITASGKFPRPDGAIIITVDDVYRTSTTSLSASTGIRQQFLTVPVGGSVRTQGNLVIADETPESLGTVLVYTTPIDSAAAQPPLRRWRTAGSAESTDATMVSGKFSDLTTLHYFDIPAPNVPAGGYLLLARIKNTADDDWGVAWSGQSLMGSTVLDVVGPHGSTGGTLAATDEWEVVTVGHMTLPTFNLGTAGLVRVGMLGSANILLDEAWLFNMDQGRLTWVEAGTGTPAAGGPANRVFIDSASLDNPVPTVSLGNADDRSDAYGAGALMPSFGEHEMTPPLTNLFVVHTNSVSAAVSGSMYDRHHTHVA